MLNYLLGVNGPISVNGVNYDTVQAAVQDLQAKQFHGELSIVLGKSTAAPQAAAKSDNIKCIQAGGKDCYRGRYNIQNQSKTVYDKGTKRRF